MPSPNHGCQQPICRGTAEVRAARKNRTTINMREPHLTVEIQSEPHLTCETELINQSSNATRVRAWPDGLTASELGLTV